MRRKQTKGQFHPLHIREENELLKLRLSAQFGTDIGSSENMPAEVENSWLQQVEAMERANVSARKISVAAYLGNPRYAPERQLKECELDLALKLVLNDLDKAGIDVDTVCKVPDREFYRYLTEELVLEDIPDIRFDGLRQHFVFDEFFPNDEFEIEHTLIEFFEMVFGKYISMLESIMYVEEGKEMEDMPDQLRLVEKIITFSDAFDKLELVDFDVKDISIFGKDARAHAWVRFEGHPNASDPAINIEGLARFRMKLDHFNCWTIEKFSLPGVS